MRARPTWHQWSLSILISFVLTGSLPALSPQEQQDRPTESQIDLKATSEAVIVDLVVRDERGRPVLDLGPQEVEVFENGESQKIISFYAAAEGVLSGARAAASSPGPMSDAQMSLAGRSIPGMQMPNLVILVFDELSLESGVRAGQAARQLIASLDESTWVGVFRITRTLVPLSGFSQDSEILTAAVESATRGSQTIYPPLTGQLQEETDQYLEMVEQFRASQGALGGISAQASDLSIEVKMQEMLVNMLRFQEAAQKDQRGGSTLHSLMSLLKGTADLQGRKSLLFFCENLALTSNLDSLYDGVIDLANRANVSIYAFDTGGLRTERPLEPSGTALRQAAELGRLQQQTISFFSTVDEMKLVDIGYDTLGMDRQGLLHELSERTGGFATVNSNDLRVGLDRVVEDISAFYELAYVPSRLVYDGTYRRIEVRVLRPGVRVQARDGYFAVPRSGGLDVLPFEIPLLARLNQPGAPDGEVGIHTSALHFEQKGRQTEAVLVLEFPLADLRFEADQETKSFRSHFACLLLLRDSSGEIVEKFSQDYPLRGPLKNLAPLRKGHVIFLRQVSLDPGRYTLQAAVREPESGRLGAVDGELEIVESASGPGMSSIILIRQSNPLTEVGMSADDPLRFQNSKIVPNISGLVDRKTDPNLLVFLNIYPDPLGAGPPDLTLELLEERKRGKPKLVASLKPPLPAPDAKGRISFVYGLPVASYKAGPYLLRVGTTQAGAGVEETVRVVLK